MIRLFIGILFLYILYAGIRLFVVDKANEIPLPYEEAHANLFEHLHEAVPQSIQQDILCELLYLQERAQAEKLDVKPILRVGYQLFTESQQLIQMLEQRCANRSDTAVLFAWEEDLERYKRRNLKHLERLRKHYQLDSKGRQQAEEALSTALTGWPDSLYLHHPKRNAIHLLHSIAAQPKDETARELSTVICNNLLKDSYRAVAWLVNFAEVLYGEKLSPELRVEWMEIRRQMPLLLIQE